MINCSDIPEWVIKSLPVPWESELKAAFNIPFDFGGIKLYPPPVGVFPLFEATGCGFIIDAGNLKDVQEIFNIIYILVKKSHCAAECFEHREHVEKDISGQSELEANALLFMTEAGIITETSSKEELFDSENLSALWDFINISFSGYYMIHGGKGKSSEWLFGLDSVAAYLSQICAIAGIDYHEALWNFPLAMGSHLIARKAVENPDIKLYRPTDTEHLKRVRKYQIDKELAGEILFWQKAYPEHYDLSKLQIVTNANIIKEFIEIKKAYKAMMPDERKEYSLEIIQSEGVQ